MIRILSLALFFVFVFGSCLIGQDKSKVDPEQAYLDHLKGLDEEELIQSARKLKEAFAKKLLTPHPTKKMKYQDFAGKKNSGINRILERGIFQFEGILPRGGGAYFSFTTRTNDYNQEPDIELQGGRFMSGFAGGDFGVVRVIEGKSITTVTMDDVPVELKSLSATELEEWLDARRRERPPLAKVGNLYVVRSVRSKSGRAWTSDLIAAFEVIEKDKYGATIVWKKLKTILPVAVR